LNVIFRTAFACSAWARAWGLQPIELFVPFGEVGALGAFDRQGEGARFAFVAQVGEGGQVVAGPLAQRGRDFGMGLQAGEVVFSAGTDG
jgi:hypothetical protein